MLSKTWLGLLTKVLGYIETFTISLVILQVVFDETPYRDWYKDF